MYFYLVIEPSYSGTYWCNQYVKGIKYETMQNNKAIYETDIRQLSMMLKNKKKENNREIVILLGTTVTWILKAAVELKRLQVHVVLISPFIDVPLLNVSSISADYGEMVRSLYMHMFNSGKKKIALFGCHPNSIGDIAKRQTFENLIKSHNVNIDHKSMVFENYGNLDDTCESFFSSYINFDSVICCSDIAAIKLLCFLKNKNVKVPDQLWIAAIGDTMLGRMIRPSITTALLDCIAIGKQSIKLCMLLAKNPSLTSLHAKVSGYIDIRETTKFPHEKTLNTTVDVDVDLPRIEILNFYSDKNVDEIFCLEELLTHCNLTDIQILEGIRCGMHYWEIAERLFISESTIKYRLKRLQTISKQENREDIIILFEKYLDFNDLLKHFQS